MRKLVKSSALLLLVAAISANSFGQYFKEKDKVLNFGLGFGSGLYATGSSVSMPPISASFEYGVKEGVGPGVIGIGGLIGHTSAKYSVFTYDWKTSYTVIGLRGAYHFVDLVDKLDPYAGIMLGYSIVSNSGSFGTNSTQASGANFSIYGGVRYYLTDNIALMGEVGFGFTIINIGLAVKF